MTSFLGTHLKRYTLERLKFLYSDLLQSIDISKEELGQRGCIDGEWSDDEEQRSKDSSDGESNNWWSITGFRRSLDVLPMIGKQRRRRRSKRARWRTGQQELASAFRVLAATRAPDKEGDNGGAAALRDDDSVSALYAAKRIEKRVVDIIREIGEVVVNGEKLLNATLRSSSCSSSRVCDPCFEYFCEKNMLCLFVDIAKQNPYNESKSISAQHGVVWSPLVKAQVLQTVSLLVSAGARNDHFLYYILSQNSINELISCMLPPNRWTDPALDKLIPAFVDLLKNLGLQLAGAPDLFPFFTDQESFPLFHAALEIGTSSYAQTDSFVHITCLSLIVNIMKIDSSSILHWISTAVPEMQKLSNHLCQLLLNRYHRIADLSTGPIVDGMRSNAVAGQLVALLDQINVLNDVFSCGIPGLNVRLCEHLIRRVISVVLNNIEPPKERAFLHVGVSDLDVIPYRECLAQVSVFFLAQLVQEIDYLPFVRMLAVALFHPKSTPLLINYNTKSKQQTIGPMNKDDYIFVPALDAIAQGKLADVVENPFRRALVNTLSGDYGEWRFPVAAIVVETVLLSDAIDLETLQLLEIIPRFKDEDDADSADKEEKSGHYNGAGLCVYTPTAFEKSLTTFLEDRSHRVVKSSISKQSLECAGSLALALFYKSQTTVVTHAYASGKFKAVSFPDGSSGTPLHNAILNAKQAFCKRAIESQKCLAVSNIFLELVEAAVRNRYKKVAASSYSGLKFPSRQVSTYACHLSQIGCAAFTTSPDLLVRNFRCVKFTDVEEARFNIEMAIHFRSLCKVFDSFVDKLQKYASTVELSGGARDNGAVKIALDLIDVADDLALTFGGLGDRPDVSADLDLRGRMTFPCCLSASRSAADHGAPSPITKSTEDAILRHAATLVMVVDPSDIFVVKPNPKSTVDRGTIVCRVALQSVIAAASDAECLHIAVRHPDVGRLIKNGNMVLQFENTGTCLIVRQYLDRARNTMQRELNERFRVLVEPETMSEATSIPSHAPTGASNASGDVQVDKQHRCYTKTVARDESVAAAC